MWVPILILLGEWDIVRRDRILILRLASSLLALQSESTELSLPTPDL